MNCFFTALKQEGKLLVVGLGYLGQLSGKLYDYLNDTEYFSHNILICTIISISCAIEGWSPRVSRTCLLGSLGLFPVFNCHLGDAARVQAVVSFFLGPSINFVYGKDYLDFAAYILSTIVGLLIITYEVINYPEIFSGSVFAPLIQNKYSRFQVIFMVCMTILLSVVITVHRNSITAKQENYEKQILSANRSLKNTLQEKENLILQFSHEIRNPLNSLLGNVNLLSDMVKVPKHKQMLKDSKVCGEILLQLLNNILDSAKMSIGQLETASRPTNIKEFLQKFWIVGSEMTQKKKIHGMLYCDSEIPEHLQIDDHRLMQIMINLASNATKFTEQGSVTIHVEFVETSDIKDIDMRPQHLTIRHSFYGGSDVNLRGNDLDIQELCDKSFEFLGFEKKAFTKRGFMYPPSKTLISQSSMQSLAANQFRKKSGFLRIEVSDTGCGMSPERLQKLFTKFGQVNEDNMKRQIGTGLGLWITKKLVNLMQGDIQVYSEVGQGSCFIFAIKTENHYVSPCPTQSLKSETSIMNYGEHRTQRALIMEDIPYNQEINKHFLKQLGVDEVCIASNGAEGVEIYNSKGSGYFNLILSDMDMPVMNGVDACNGIRKTEKLKEWSPCPIVVLTGHASRSLQDECTSTDGLIRAHRFLCKPAGFESLKTTLKELGICQKRGSEAVKTVLIVDDDAFNCNIISEIVTRCDYKVMTANNGEQAINIFKKHKKEISLVFMDCEMPVMDGFESTHQIITEHEFDEDPYEVTIIGLTGHTGADIEQKCIKSGMQKVLTKPIDPSVIQNIVKTHNF